ncbi:S8 family serine peptidase [Bifidobacterium sp. 79T10]|nr:S8 family serine peptidase [Bifidobacterium saguinibicoloris]
MTGRDSDGTGMTGRGTARAATHAATGPRSALAAAIGGIVAAALGCALALTAPLANPATAYADDGTASGDTSTSNGTDGANGSNGSNSSSNGGQCQAGVENSITQTPWTNTLFELDQLHHHATGAGVTVAVIDSGVDTDNPHLDGAVTPGMSLIPDDPSNGMADTYNHGTAVAGIIAARPVDGSQVQGIAPEATILPIRVFQDIREENGRQTGAPSMEDVASAVTYAVDHGARVINISLSDIRDIPEMRQAVSYAESHGSLIVASAGNRLTSSTTKDGERYPAAYPEVVGVTALDTTLNPTNDSVHGDQVDVAAPGADVATTVPGGLDCVFATDAASSSFATAYVSGEAALIASAHPDETPEQWRQRILTTANRTNPDQRDDQTGWGVMDPLNAIDVTLSPHLRGPAGGGRHASTAQDPIVLHPVKDANAQVKRIVAITAIGLAALWGVAFLRGLGRRDGQADGQGGVRRGTRMGGRRNARHDERTSGDSGLRRNGGVLRNGDTGAAALDRDTTE